MACPVGLIRKLCALPDVGVFLDAPLAPLTTFGTGGNADLLVEVSTTQAVSSVLAALDSYGVEWVCLGSGSNILVADEGFRGAVVKLGRGFDYVEGLPKRPALRPLGQPLGSRYPRANDYTRASDGLCLDNPQSGSRTAVISAGGATKLARLAWLAARAGLSGLEFACGIPGTVGGAVVCNAGAHGACMEDVVEEVEITSAHAVEIAPASSLGWAYRCCTLPHRAIVTGAKLVLAFSDPGLVHQQQRSYLQRRLATQPRRVRTFGSVFKNPSTEQAGRLLDEAGLKGMRVGDVEVSRIHANFLENRGNGTTRDALLLIALMRETVLARTGVLLEPEVRLLGTKFLWEKDG